MLDSLKTTAVGFTGVGVTWLEFIPITVRVLVGIATFFYILVKIYKLLEK